MTITLKKSENSLFSPRQQKILKILGDKKMTTAAICEKYFTDEDETISPRNSISDAIFKINMKCEFYQLNWFIDGHGTGRRGRTVWKAKR